MTVIDCHAHVLTEATIARIAAEVPSLAPKLTVDATGDGVLEVAGIRQHPFPRGAWDLERRLADMRAQGVDVQVLCNIPHTFLYEADPGAAATVAAIQNEAVAALVREHPDRFLGMATVPMQAPEAAAAELRRAVIELGLRGLHLGTHVAGRNLDDPALDPVWEEADRHGLLVLVHPHKIAAAERMRGYYLHNLVGNPFETTLAAASLVFGGVIERHPRIRFLLSHGGGFVPYQAGRLRHGWQVRPEPRARLRGDPAESLDRLLHDSITHDAASLAFLLDGAGPERVVFGTDYPFDMGTTRGVEEVAAVLPEGADRQRVLAGNAAALLRRPAAG